LINERLIPELTPEKIVEIIKVICKENNILNDMEKED